MWHRECDARHPTFREKRGTPIVPPLLILLAQVGLAPTVFAAAPAKPIKIGLTFELTGAHQVYGTGCRNGVQLFIDKVNKEGGVLGRTVELQALDDKSKADEAVKNAIYLISTEKADIMLGGINSAASLAVSALSKREKVPFFAMGSTSELTMKQGHRYVFRAILNTTTQGRGAARFVNDKWPNAKRFFVIGADFEFGRMAAKEFLDEMKRLNPNIELIGEAWTKVAETDFSN